MRPYGQQPTRLLCPQDSLGKNTGVGAQVEPMGNTANNLVYSLSFVLSRQQICLYFYGESYIFQLVYKQQHRVIPFGLSLQGFGERRRKPKHLEHQCGWTKLPIASWEVPLLAGSPAQRHVLSQVTLMVFSHFKAIEKNWDA